jgi:hypothetical protein
LRDLLTSVTSLQFGEAGPRSSNLRLGGATPRIEFRAI